MEEMLSLKTIERITSEILRNLDYKEEIGIDWKKTKKSKVL